MFTGQSCDWSLSRPFLWACSHDPGFRHDDPGAGEYQARGLQAGDGRAEEDDGSAHYDRLPLWLRDRGQRRYRDWLKQRDNGAITPVTSPANALLHRGSPRWHRSFSLSILSLLFLLAFVLPLAATRPASAQAVYDDACLLCQSGDLALSQKEAESAARQFQGSDPSWALRFTLLEADSMLRRGMYEDALHVTSALGDSAAPDAGAVERLAIEAVALTRQQQISAADQPL